MALKDDVEQLSKNQHVLRKDFLYLKKRMDALEQGGIDEPEEIADEEPFVDDPTATETSKPIENLGFKIFGGIGFFLILLGLFYLYDYAVDNGWIGILGRVILGVVFSLIIIGIGEYFRSRKYEKFSQLLTGGGLALLYFVFFATYRFEEYRKALGMTLIMNTVLLTVVMIFAVLMALHYKSQILAGFSFFLGYLSAFLSSSGTMEPTLIYALILSIGIVWLVTKQNWQLGLMPLIASYLLYLIYLGKELISRYGYTNGTTMNTTGLWGFLIAFAVLFTIQSLFLRDDKNEYQNVIISFLNASVLFGAGLAILHTVAPDLKAAYAVILAVVYLLQAFVAKEKKHKNLFETLFILCITFLTVAIPLQLNGHWVTILWAVEGYLLLRAGVKMQHYGLRVLAYIVQGIALLSALQLLGNSSYWRTIGVLVVCAALYLSARSLSTIQKNETQYQMEIWLSMTSLVLFTILLSVEIFDPRGYLDMLSSNARTVLLSVVWAAEAVFTIAIGITNKVKALRVFGLILFSLTIGKVLLIDLGALQGISRTIVTMMVGIIALVASFYYVKNKERIKAMLE